MHDVVKESIAIGISSRAGQGRATRKGQTKGGHKGRLVRQSNRAEVAGSQGGPGIWGVVVRLCPSRGKSMYIVVIDHKGG